MIANITKGADFGGLCRYLLHPFKTAQIIGGNLGGKTPPELEAEFLAFANLNQLIDGQKSVIIRGKAYG